MSLELWDKVREVPETAKKPISGGRLNGKTDINPVWRIKTLTEQFGACGIGWYYEITDKRLESGSASQIAAFVDINLFINDPSTGWSKPIPGTGGSMFIENEKSGPHTSDECFKMALTDALSVACKALGIGADVYWQKDANKYDKSQETPPAAPQAKAEPKPGTLTQDQLKQFQQLCPDDAAKARLKKAVTDIGYDKLSSVLLKDFDKLMDLFTGVSLPFDI